MAISNLLQPNPTVPNLLSSLAPKKTTGGLISTMLPNGSTSVGTPGQTGGYNTAIGTAPSAPVATVASRTTAPATTNSTVSGAGSYKGVPLSGTDAQIAEQMRKIDNPAPVAQNLASTTQPIASGSTVTSPAPTTTQPQPVRGLFQDVTSSLARVGQQGSEGYNKAIQNLTDFDRALAQKYGAIESTPIPLNFQQGREQVIARQAASERAALQGAVNQQQTQQGQLISALSSAGGLASPRSADLLVDPVTGEPIGDINNMGSALANWASIRAGANTAGNFTADYQTGLANLRAADSIGQQIKNTITNNPTINSQPLSAWTNIKQLLSAQFSDPAQQLLAQQVNQYIQTLGLDENTVMNIASQQQGTLGQLLDSLRQQAAGQVESKNPQNVINNPQGTNSNVSTGGQVINTAVGPIDNAWFN